MVEEAHDDGARSRIRRFLKQLRTDRDKENVVREFLEEIQRNVDETPERARGSRSGVCAGYRPHNFRQKMWHMMLSHNTKSMNMESKTQKFWRNPFGEVE